MERGKANEVVFSEEYDWPDHPAKIVGKFVEVHLNYEGLLPAAGKGNSRVAVKDAIRCHFSNQLWDLAAQEPLLPPEIRNLTLATPKGPRLIPIVEGDDPGPVLAAQFKDRLFAPIVSEVRRLTCHLEITLLQRRPPGSILSGGDIDNRLKVSLDALRMPHDDNEVLPLPEGASRLDNDSFVLCLLQDDALVTQLTVKTGRLLGATSGQPEGFVRALIVASLKGRHDLTDWMGQPV